MKICNRLGLDPEVRKMVEQAAMDYVTEASEKTKEKAPDWTGPVLGYLFEVPLGNRCQLIHGRGFYPLPFFLQLKQRALVLGQSFTEP